jgi:RNA polymerase sigma-70 factor (ECF subfamily)
MDYRNIILDLREVRLVDRDAVKFLRGCEADGMKLENCPAYIASGWTEKKVEGTSPGTAAGYYLKRGSVLAMTTLLSAQINALAASDLREWSEEQLIAAGKTGKRAPFGELCERHVKKVFSVAHRITRNREDAEDAVQDCFLSAFVHLNRFDGRSRFATWLTRIAINAALMKLRQKRAIREVPVEEPNPSPALGLHWEIQDAAHDPEETYRLHERKQILDAAISELRPRTREVVKLHKLQEHSVRETAQMLGISTAAVKARMFHARIALHRMPLLTSVAKPMWRALVK